MNEAADNRNETRRSDAGEAIPSVVSLVEAGLPLEEGLRALSEEAPSRRLRRTLRTMSDELAAGAPPDDVLMRDGAGLPGYIRSLVRSGVKRGQLGAFLEEFLRAVRQRKSARRGFWLALCYPLLLVPLVVVAAATLVGYVVPQFKDIYNDFGVELPTLTLLFVNLSDLLTSRVILGVAAVALLVVLLLQVVPHLFGAAAWTRLVQRIPLVGTPSRMRGMSEFCSLLGLLVSGELPLPDALEATSGALEDANLKSGSKKLAQRVDHGESMPDAAAALPNFSAELQNLFHWEQRGTAFGEILRHAGSVYSARSRVQLGVVGVFFLPLLLLFIGGVLGMTVVALFMPLIKLLNELS